MNQQQIIAGVTSALPMHLMLRKRKTKTIWYCKCYTNFSTNWFSIRKIERQRNLAPFAALQQYSSLVNPIATGFPVQQQQTDTSANPVTTALGGALIGSKFGGFGAAIGGGLGFLGGLL